MFHGNNERYPNPTYHFSQSFIVLVMLCTQNSAKFSIDSTRFTFFSSIYISAILVAHTRIKEPPLAHFIPFPSHIALRIFPILFFFSSSPFTSQKRSISWIFGIDYPPITVEQQLRKTINIICECAC